MDPQRELFYTIFRWITTTTSLCSNLLLLVVIYISPSSQLGHYRFLLAIFAICDIFTSFMHHTFQPIVHLTSTGVYAISREAGKRVFYGVSLDIPIILMFIVAFYQTFLILAYHYVYRYRTVTSLFRSSRTDLWSTRQWFSVGAAVYVMYISSVIGAYSMAFLPDEWTRKILNPPSELLELHGLDLHSPDTGYSCFVPLRACSESDDALCWHWRSLFAMSIVVAMFSATAGVIAYCIYQTRSTFKSSSHLMTPKTKKMQRDLFNALLIQTAVPFLLSYVPLSAIILSPSLTGTSVGDAYNLIFSATAIFPAIDSFFVLFFIAKYRRTVTRLFRLPFSGYVSDVSSSERQESKKTTVNPYHSSFTVQ